MAAALGRPDANLPAESKQRLTTAKKKGCRRKKCSNWKGGKCCCGRE